MSTRFRTSYPEDAAQCLALRGETRENAVSIDTLRARGITEQSWADDIRRDACSGHVCLDGAEIVGYCFGAKRSGEILVLAVSPAFENRGIGRALLGRVMHDLEQSGLRRLFLGCSTDPKSRSYGFYRHLGWRSTGALDAAGDEILEFVFSSR